MSRISSVDVTRGLLMLLVIYYHTLNILSTCCPTFINNNNWYLFETPYLFRTFFMTTFFVVSGMISSFRRDIKDQIKHDFFTLLMPSIIICTIIGSFVPEAVDNGNMVYIQRIVLFGGGAWFVVAMFLARFLYKIMLLIDNDKVRWAVILLFWLTGCLADVFIPNEYKYWYFPKAVFLMAYIELGRIVMKYDNMRKTVAVVGLVLYTMLIPMLLHWGDRTPHLSDTSAVYLRAIPLFGLVSVIGSIVVYAVGKLIKSNSIFEYIGRNSLVFYLTHIVFLFIACKYLNNIFCYEELSFGTSLAIIILLVFSASLWCSTFSVLLNTKYLKWILGKF